MIKKIDNQSAPFIYSLVFHDKDRKIILPLAEFISTAHDSHTISTYLSKIKDDLERSIPKNGFQIAPFICTDFSWSLLNAVCKVFNSCDFDFYIKWCYEMMFKRTKSLIIYQCMKVILHLCGAHFLKLIIKKVRKINPFDYKRNKEYKKMNRIVQQTFIFAFTLLQNASKVDEFIDLFLAIYVIFNSQFNTRAVVESKKKIKLELVKRRMTVFSLKIDDETTEEFKNKREDDHYHEFIKFTSNDFDETSLKKSSPFTNYFQNLLKKQPELNLSTNDSINEYYSTDMFSIIVEYLYILPLWSWIMKDLWIRLNPQSNLQDLHSLTNNNVENWFDQLKNGLLQGKTSMPSIYATKVYNTVEAKYESYYKNERIVLNQNKKKFLTKFGNQSSR